MFKKILILAVVLAFVSSAVFAFDTTTRRYPGNTDRGGIVTEGVKASFEGTLRYETPIWYLDTASGSYALRLGNRNFISETGTKLIEGAKCSVEGFQAGDDIAVSSMAIGGKTYMFRDQNGVPLWAGEGRQTEKAGLRGNRQNTDAQQYGRANDGSFKNGHSSRQGFAKDERPGFDRSNRQGYENGRMMGDHPAKRGFDHSGKLGFNRPEAGQDRSGKPDSGQGRGMNADHARKSGPGQGGKQHRAECDGSGRR